MKNKILITIALCFGLVLGGGYVAAPPAQAVWGNTMGIYPGKDNSKIMVNFDEYYSGYRFSGSRMHNVRSITIYKGWCVTVQNTRTIRYCTASSDIRRNIVIPAGTTYVWRS